MPERGPLRLDQFLKLCGVVQTGGHAKLMIQGGDVLVNGDPETRRRRKLIPGDVVHVDGNAYRVNESIPEKPDEDKS